MARIILDGVTKVFEQRAAVRDVSLDVADGELLVLVGPSGGGKTTLLRIIAGLENPASGTVFFDDRDVTNEPPRSRNICMVFQRPALFPAQTVRGNLQFGDRVRQPSRSLSRRIGRFGELRRRQIEYEEAKETEQLLEISRTLGLAQLLDRRGAELSGGEQQRVALGRAWLRRPAAFLLDEPLGHVDSPLRWELRRQLHLLQRRLKATMIYVTHDPAEALDLADRIAVLGGGMLHQVGTPSEVADQPVSRLAAQFGTKYPLNCLEGRIDEGPGVLAFTGPGFAMAVPRHQESRLSEFRNQDITLGFRSENVAVSDRAYDNNPVEMTVEHIESIGPAPLVTCTRGAGKIVGIGVTPLKQDQTVMVSLRWDRVFVFDRASGRTLSGPAG